MFKQRFFYPLAFATAATVIGLSACSQGGSDGHASDHAHASHEPITIDSPSGKYAIDPTHAIVAFQVSHLGISKYTARFNDFNVQVSLDSDNVENSTVTADIKVASIDTGYTGDYKATHKKSIFATWDDDLALNPKWFNGNEYPSIAFTSTKVSEADGQLNIDGDLTFLGTTKPITLTATVSGSAEAHPFRKVGTIGFSATGTFKRSDFGMTHLLSPPLIGDEVTLLFEGEFLQQIQ